MLGTRVCPCSPQIEEQRKNGGDPISVAGAPPKVGKPLEAWPLGPSLDCMGQHGETLPYNNNMYCLPKACGVQGTLEIGLKTTSSLIETKSPLCGPSSLSPQRICVHCCRAPVSPELPQVEILPACQWPCVCDHYTGLSGFGSFTLGIK